MSGNSKTAKKDFGGIRVTHAYSSSRSDWILARQHILGEIMASEPSRRWTDADLAEKMREHPIVAEVQPKYTDYTAKLDRMSITKDWAAGRKELVGAYLIQQLEQLDEMSNDAMRMWREVMKLDPSAEVAQSAEDMDKLSIALGRKVRAAKEIAQTIAKLQQRYESLIPLAVPKQIDLNAKVITLDSFLKVREEVRNAGLIEGASGQLSSGADLLIEDGEFEDVEQ